MQLVTANNKSLIEKQGKLFGGYGNGVTVLLREWYKVLSITTVIFNIALDFGGKFIID